LVKEVIIIGLEKFGMMEPGDDIAASIFEALTVENIEVTDSDVVVVSQKVISKTEGLLVDISTIKPSSKAKLLSKRTRKDSRLIELILRDSSQLIGADRRALMVRRKNGFICLNAGVDKSNAKGRSVYSRLPANADISADELRCSPICMRFSRYLARRVQPSSQRKPSY
jgi:coenzyme F420-0:L-glutamate ligase/coenzyme F420-1:gamma-L-glutamate ligase